MEKGEGRSRATETRTSILTHLRCDLFFATISLLFLDSHFMGLFALGAGWISLFLFKDLEAETINVCIAWALLKYLGCAFLLLFIVCLFLSAACAPRISCFALWDFLSLYIDFMMGRWVIRDTHLLPCHGDVAGWVWLRAKPWDAELLSV